MHASPRERVQRVLDEATPGPWENGDAYGFAGVMPEKFGEGRCALCAGDGEPIWVGRTNINGRRMLAHLHRRDEAFGVGHQIVARTAPDEVAGVAGNYDFEEGGIVVAEDARAIVLLRNLAPALLRLWAAVEDMVDTHPLAATNWVIESRDNLNAAAAREVGGEEDGGDA